MAHPRRSRESRHSHSGPRRSSIEPAGPTTVPPHASTEKQHHRLRDRLPVYNHNGHKVTKGIQPEGESGRSGFHPLSFLRICFRSSCFASKIVNILWPIVPVAIALHFSRPDWHLAIFVTNYFAMLPAANLIGFAGQELARKLPKAPGVVLEISLGSIVEIVLFMVLIKNSDGTSNIQVIRAAILGSILANLLLCLGFCFIAGGVRHKEQEFHGTISEAGSGLMLVAGMALVIPAAFAKSLAGNPQATDPTGDALRISRAAAIIMLAAYLVFVLYQTKTHDTLYGEVFEADEEKDVDRARDLAKAKLTFVECIIALLIAIACVSMIAVFLVLEIPFMNEERHIPDAFLGLILVPLVEKAAEHLTAIDEAWDNQMNFALSHVLGASIQTALFNTPLVILVGWGLHKQMDLNFEIFEAVVLILAILVIGSFLRDGKSNYLEGVLLVFVYILIAVTAWYFPDPPHHGTTGGGEGGGEGGHH